MTTKDNQNYQSPLAECFNIRLEDVICGTQPGKLKFTHNPGSAGDDIDIEDIIDGGSF